MDILLFKEINSATAIKIQKNGRIIEFFPLNQIREGGKNRWGLKLEGFSRQKVAGLGRCYIYFKGHELSGTFSNCVESGQQYLATFNTFIPVPEFWGEPADPDSSNQSLVWKKQPDNAFPANLVNAVNKKLARIKRKLKSFRQRPSSS